MARLTIRALETTKPGPVRREIPDSFLPGLYFVVQQSGARSWAVRYRHHSVSRKHTLGGFPKIDLKAARALGGKALRAAAEGHDPGREKILARTAKVDSVDRIVEEFLDRHVRRSNRPRPAQETERLLRQHVLPRWRARMMHEITRRDVLDVLDRVVDGGAPIAANRVFAAVRKLFNWCVARDIIAASPCAGVKPPTAERARERVLSDDELRLVWAAADKLSGTFGPLVKLLALTGQRRDEIARMRWEEIKDRVLVLPGERTKNGQPHEVPLSTAALAVLQRISRVEGSPYVFTTNGGASPASGYSKNKRRLDALLPADMTPWRLHDLRRTCASGMARLGINLPVIEKCLNHASGSFAGIVGVYQRHSFADEKRQALEAWGKHVDSLTSGKTTSKVVGCVGSGRKAPSEILLPPAIMAERDRLIGWRNFMRAWRPLLDRLCKITIWNQLSKCRPVITRAQLIEHSPQWCIGGVPDEKWSDRDIALQVAFLNSFSLAISGMQTITVGEKKRKVDSYRERARRLRKEAAWFKGRGIPSEPAEHGWAIERAAAWCEAEAE
jgi:integrase